ncbi:hypothetical protein [Nocardia transvalensis]|uniref:hypothetical protein n=1 Tax=Nocardia transvalensis TaxID=37333 RepID=UPI00189345A0|nr:hypothetical protein [Nocardia transvalensis]MBF6333885.1 hypothetical protein [Nocardia transvalensis]
MAQPSEFVFDVARGDLGVSRQLRQSLQVIKSATTDPALRRQLDDVLAGRTGMREFGTSDAFARILDRVPRQQFDRVFSMPEEERERLAAQGRAELERLRNESPEQTASMTPPPEPPRPGPASPSPAGGHVIRGTRKPNREQLFIPDEPDDDDRYFQERRQRGWLE